MKLTEFIKNCHDSLPILADYKFPWEITERADEVVKKLSERFPVMITLLMAVSQYIKQRK